ncbi:uncharacterized protein LOC129723578 [Wyeomyia smithii]|uniref:uncharacterized protein LOC129723578 n=1 Tax=Wyeomyia smithii TaxID=174621 RepID=UPI002467D622|nr:uncharacterized protein LOC129723578 [Wyeomyia smithii]
MDELQQLHRSVDHQYSDKNPVGNNNKPLKDEVMQDAGVHDGSGHSVDSGYNSYQSFNASSSVARSVLATIEEDNEADTSLDELRSSETPLSQNSILTPTTAASIEQISNFHLTTPNSAMKKPLEKRIVLARKPTCQNLFVQRTPDKTNDENNFYDQKGTPVRSGRKSTLGSFTPRKNKASAKRKLSTFREKLYSDGDNTENLRSQIHSNDSLNADCKQLEQEDISPIFHSKRRRNSVIDDLIRSSTPKTASFEQRSFNVETRENIDHNALPQRKVDGYMRKPLTLRRFQSFSPSKMHSYRGRGSILQEQSMNTNHRAPLQRQNALEVMSPRNTVRPSTITTTQKASVKSTDKAKSTKTVDIVPAKTESISALLDAPLLPLQSSSVDNLKEADLDREITQLPSFDDFSLTPCKANITAAACPQDSILREAPVRKPACMITSILDNDSAFIDSLSIPITPTSIGKSTKLKRLSSRSLSSTKKGKSRSKPSSPKLRSQPVIPGTYRRSYVGVERLNILKRLNEQDKDALGILLDYLADSDLVQVVAVSRGWRSIIESHRRVSRRLHDFLARESHYKENLDRTGLAEVAAADCSFLLLGKSVSSDGAKELKDSVAATAQVIHRQPFSLCNSIDGNSSALEQRRASSVQKSPPVSPSKRKFRENQKIASHLKKSERLKTCPRCEKPSRVVLCRTRLAPGVGNLSPGSVVKVLEKSYTLPDTSSSNNASAASIVSPVSPNKSDRIRRNLFSTSLLPRACSAEARSTPVFRGNATRRRSSADGSANLSASLMERKMLRNGSHQKRDDGSQCDYAVCSGKSCGFVFCIKCLCEYHPDSVCKDLAPNSPSKEDEPAHNVACSKQSRRSLLRLRK